MSVLDDLQNFMQPGKIVNVTGMTAEQCRLCGKPLAFVSVTGYGLIAHFCQNRWCVAYGVHTSAVLDRSVNSTVNSGSPDGTPKGSGTE